MSLSAKIGDKRKIYLITDAKSLSTGDADVDSCH